MITFKELIKNTQLNDIPISHQQNLQNLLVKINVIRKAYGKPMTVTSGYRSMQDHLRIYSSKGITDKSKIPMSSGHLRGECVDIADSNGELREWILLNLGLCKDIGLWLEDFRYTKGWIHLGIRPPKSNKRIFIPYSGSPPHPELWDGNYDNKLD